MPGTTHRHGNQRRQRKSRVLWSFAIGALLGAPVVALGVPDVVRIPMVEPRKPGDPPDAARFSHWSHDEFSCVTCHPSLFPTTRYGFTHKEMDQGLFCGSCHDGSNAWSPRDRGVTCETCHVPPGRGEDIDEDDLW